MKSLNRLVINLKNIEENISNIKSLTNNTPFLLPIKANAYGHGLVNVVKYFLNNPIIDFYAVANIQEASEIRKYDVEKKILLLGAPTEKDYEKVVALQINPTISTIENHEIYNKLTDQYGVHLPAVHIKMDTGMGRNGLTKEQLAEVLKTNKYKIEGVYTHFSTAEDFDMSYFLAQKGDFFNIVSSLKHDKLDIKYFHCANSAATLKDDSTHMNLTRVGLASYGYYETPELESLVDLKPALSLSSQLISIKNFPEGSKISYGATWEAKRDSIIGIIPLGYGDGIHRVLSNKMNVIINDTVVPVVGNITMDMMMLDLTDVKGEIKVGTEVKVITADKNCSVETMAINAGTIPYEITCHLRDDRLTREFIS